MSQEDSDTASFAGVTFDMSEFDVSMQDNLGTPSEYSKRTETEFGQERTIAVLTYENEIEGLCVVLEYDTIDNYILSIEISKTNSASVS